MTATLSCVAQRFEERISFDLMPHRTARDWRQPQDQQQYYNEQMAMAAHQPWTDPMDMPLPDNNIPNIDFRSPFPQDNQQHHSNQHQQPHHAYSNPYAYGTSSTVTSPDFAYSIDANWPSETDINTFSTPSYPFDPSQRALHPELHQPFHLPHASHSPNSAITQTSSRSSIGGPPAPTDLIVLPDGPSLSSPPTTTTNSRNADKQARPRRATTALTTDLPKPTTEEGDTTARGGKRRPRIPHTVVERRYRENLNAHLEKLRESVPTFRRSSTTSNGKGGEGHAGVKPSKCEVINGAIEYIVLREKENEGLKEEVRMLTARMEEMGRRLEGRQNGWMG